MTGAGSIIVRPQAPKQTSSTSTSSSKSIIMMDKVSDGDGPVSTHTKSLFPCTNLWQGPEGANVLDSFQIPLTQAQPLPLNEIPNSRKNWKIGSSSNNCVKTSEVSSSSTPDKSMSPALGNPDTWLTSGRVVWAKTLDIEWWPAEVLDEKVVGDCTGSEHTGQVLVQLFGKNQHVWLDPVSDLSKFDHCYEERSVNPSTEFQVALKQALCKDVHSSRRVQLGGCPAELKSSTPHDHSLDEQNTPSSSGAKDDCTTKDDHTEGGRGRRKRKLKFHFDEITFQENPARRLRRLRVMRSLGLIAPAGSPFALPRRRSD